MTGPADHPTGIPPKDLVLHEHQKRERAWTPAARWQAIQETIRWAEAQAAVKRNTPAACIERERARIWRRAICSAEMPPATAATHATNRAPTTPPGSPGPN